ncbi:MAG: hypothetical protein WC054_01795 [Candidatus Nanopelagicales bacterium]
MADNERFSRRGTRLTIACAASVGVVGSLLVGGPAAATVDIRTIDPVKEAGRSIALMAANSIYGFPGAPTVKKYVVMGIKELPHLASGANSMEVPFGVYHISYAASGAAGGNGSNPMTGATIGGGGGVVTGLIGGTGNAPLRVKPGEPLWMNIGSPGGNSYGLPFGGYGGYSGGGDGGSSGPVAASGGGGGGGSTHISQGGIIGSIPGIGSPNRVVVAPGGGGGGGDTLVPPGLPPVIPGGGIGGAAGITPVVTPVGGGATGLPGMVPGVGGGAASPLTPGIPGINVLPGSSPGNAGSLFYKGGFGGAGGTASLAVPQPPLFTILDGGGGGGGGSGYSGGGGGASGTPGTNPLQLTGVPFAGGGGGGASVCLHTMPCLTLPGPPPAAGPGPIALLRAPGTLSMAWASVNSIGYRANSVQRKYLIGGTYANDTSLTLDTEYISRLDDSGDADNTWQTNQSAGDFENVNVIREVTGGKTMLGGSFNVEKGSTKYSGIARLLGDGSIDTTFRPRYLKRSSTSKSAKSEPLVLAGGKVGLTTQGFQVYDVAELPGGKYLVAGSFDFTDAPVVRLMPDGLVDTTFKPPEFEKNLRVPSLVPGRRGSNDNRLQEPRVYRITKDTGGKLILSGDFEVEKSSFIDYQNMVRLGSEGALDRTFYAVQWSWESLTHSGVIRTLTPTTGGKYLVGGELPTVYRIMPDGQIDTTFTGPDMSANVGLQVPQATVNVITPVDGGAKFVIGGDFLSFGGETGMDYLGRMSANGAADSSFTALWLNGPVNDVVEIFGSNLLVGGAFTFAGTDITNFLLRTRPDGSLDPDFELPDITP